uniref:Cholesterol 24-hydroxylase n=1 Tax=Nothobranchius furzeri TaxID=105023 RepID=A0A8C6NK47_NOTFU
MHSHPWPGTHISRVEVRVLGLDLCLTKLLSIQFKIRGAFLVIVLFIAFLGYCLFIKYIHMKYDHIPGPPRDSFIFGHSPTLLRIMKNDGMVHDIQVCLQEALLPVWGKVDVTLSVLIHASLVIVVVELILTSYCCFIRKIPSFVLFVFCRFFGNGLITALDHDMWYKQRRIMDPAFSSLYLRGLMGTFNERAEKLMDVLEEAADNNTKANMLHLINCVTLDVIAKVAFGMDLDLLKNSSPFPKAIEKVLKGMAIYARDIFFQLNPKNRQFTKEVREACQLLRTTGAQVIHKRKTAMQNGEDVPKDILTQIIKSAESMTQEDEELMLDNFVTFFIAGQETTANQLSFCIMELGRHPEILEKLRKEVDEVIGMKQDISYDDLGKLVYLSQVLKETLRLYPTAPGTARQIEEDMVIDGIHIPGGIGCMFSSYTTGRMEKFFKDPLKFDPDRFHPDAPKPYYTYYPFALGPRSCLGQVFAQMEAKVVMAKLIQRFEFTLVPGQTFDILDTGTLRPKSGVVCTIKQRK